MSFEKLFFYKNKTQQKKIDGMRYAFYNFMLGMNSNTKDKTSVSYGIRQLTPEELNTHCIPNRNTTTFKEKPVPYITPNEIKFTRNFEIRTYLSGCYYYLVNEGKWTNDGTIVGPDTNITHTHCITNHLTEFAGGLVILPNEINFDLAFENPSFTSNPIIYSTIIAFMCAYIIFAILARLQDKQDIKRVGVTPLIDNKTDEHYYYEIVVFTGTRPQSSTTSNVFIVITGDKDETEARVLKDTQRKPFRRGGMDSFVMSVKQPLGNLSYIRIWHDNTGSGDDASWFLKYVIVHDVQTRERFYFVCNKWLAVEKDDCVRMNFILHF
jgi:polycystin 1L2